MATAYLKAAPVRPVSAEADATVCPVWCTVRHYPGSALDTGHFGDLIDLDLPRVDGPTETALYARLTADQSTPAPHLFVEDGLGGATLDRAAVEQLVRNARRFAAALEATLPHLPEVRS